MTAVDWEFARAVAVGVSGREPFSNSYHLASLEEGLPRLAERADELVQRTTGLVVSTPAKVRVVTRSEWIDLNLRSVRRMLRPLLERVEQRQRSLPSPIARLTRRTTALELGMVLGWMSTRVLGQYDILMVEEEGESGDEVVFVAPNILGLERALAFPPDEFRLWVALHELTHRAQFVGVPWLRDHFVSLVDSLVGSLGSDGDQISALLQRLKEVLRSGKGLEVEGGLAALALSQEQRAVLDRLSGLLALLEGHGDITMNRAGEGLLKYSQRFHRVLAERRKNASPIVKLLRRAIGLEAKLAQYELGESFVEVVLAKGGEALLRRVWEAPEMLPTMSEIRNPDIWIERVVSTVPGTS